MILKRVQVACLWINACNLLANLVYSKYMKKDSNIRVLNKDRQLLKKMAKSEGRTLKVMFGVVIKDWLEYRNSPQYYV